MAIVLRKNIQVETLGTLPAIGSIAPNFVVTLPDLSELCYEDVSHNTVVLNIFPSIDTPTCASSVREFNRQAARYDKVVVLCVSADLPFALKRFCATEGIDNVLTASSFRSNFGDDYQVSFTSGPLTGLLSRAIVVINKHGKVIYTQKFANTSDEPHYQAALAAINT